MPAKASGKDDARVTWRVRSMGEVEMNGLANVVALDPGGTTGWSVLSVYADALSDPNVSILKSIVWWKHGQIEGTEEVQVDETLGLYAQWPGAAAVCESFQIRQFNQSREFLSPVRIRSVLEWALRHGFDGEDTFGLDPRVLFTQEPALAMSTATDERLKKWGLYERTGGMGHARDADRHAITFLRRAKEKPGLRSRAWPSLFHPDGSLKE